MAMAMTTKITTMTNDNNQVVVAVDADQQHQQHPLSLSSLVATLKELSIHSTSLWEIINGREGETLTTVALANFDYFDYDSIGEINSFDDGTV